MKRLKVEHHEVYAPDGQTWHDVAIEAHSIAAAAVVALNEIKDHVERRGEHTVNRYLDVTEQLYPGSRARTEEIIEEREVAIAAVPGPPTPEAEETT